MNNFVRTLGAAIAITGCAGTPASKSSLPSKLNADGCSEGFHLARGRENPADASTEAEACLLDEMHTVEDFQAYCARRIHGTVFVDRREQPDEHWCCKLAKKSVVSPEVQDIPEN